MPTPALTLNTTDNPVLFGWEPTEGIVALELEDDRHIRLYRRVRGKLISELQEFRPMIWLQQPDSLESFRGNVEITVLSGELCYRALAVFQSWKDCLAAKNISPKPPEKHRPRDRPVIFFWPIPSTSISSPQDRPLFAG